ncbi:hypothetical protein PAPYR_1803 [Paratrimastix pyriformis]|uniref:Uncharacterized protein n=1 Tax=Paratrimastix pyriformis TaxID=342808 RepID=A0ABQ8URB5_9EUKA|nr:hypothetical protein PAPYR_1803 [Paratrimastix pyriformis]
MQAALGGGALLFRDPESGAPMLIQDHAEDFLMRVLVQAIDSPVANVSWPTATNGTTNGTASAANGPLDDAWLINGAEGEEAPAANGTANATVVVPPAAPVSEVRWQVVLNATGALYSEGVWVPAFGSAEARLNLHIPARPSALALPLCQWARLRMLPVTAAGVAAPAWLEVPVLGCGAAPAFTRPTELPLWTDALARLAPEAAANTLEEATDLVDFLWAPWLHRHLFNRTVTPANVTEGLVQGDNITIPESQLGNATEADWYIDVEETLVIDPADGLPTYGELAQKDVASTIDLTKEDPVQVMLRMQNDTASVAFANPLVPPNVLWGWDPVASPVPLGGLWLGMIEEGDYGDGQLYGFSELRAQRATYEERRLRLLGCLNGATAGTARGTLAARIGAAGGWAQPASYPDVVGQAAACVGSALGTSGQLVQPLTQVPLAGQRAALMAAQRPAFWLHTNNQTILRPYRLYRSLVAMVNVLGRVSWRLSPGLLALPEGLRVSQVTPATLLVNQLPANITSPSGSAMAGANTTTSPDTANSTLPIAVNSTTVTAGGDLAHLHIDGLMLRPSAGGIFYGRPYVVGALRLEGDVDLSLESHGPRFVGFEATVGQALDGAAMRQLVARTDFLCAARTFDEQGNVAPLPNVSVVTSAGGSIMRVEVGLGLNSSVPGLVPWIDVTPRLGRHECGGALLVAFNFSLARVDTLQKVYLMARVTDAAHFSVKLTSDPFVSGLYEMAYAAVAYEGIPADQGRAEEALGRLMGRLDGDIELGEVVEGFARVTPWYLGSPADGVGCLPMPWTHNRTVYGVARAQNGAGSYTYKFVSNPTRVDMRPVPTTGTPAWVYTGWFSYDVDTQAVTDLFAVTWGNFTEPLSGIKEYRYCLWEDAAAEMSPSAVANAQARAANTTRRLLFQDWTRVDASKRAAGGNSTFCGWIRPSLLEGAVYTPCVVALSHSGLLSEPLCARGARIGSINLPMQPDSPDTGFIFDSPAPPGETKKVTGGVHIPQGAIQDPVQLSIESSAASTPTNPMPPSQGSFNFGNYSFKFEALPHKESYAFAKPITISMTIDSFPAGPDGQPAIPLLLMFDPQSQQYVDASTTCSPPYQHVDYAKGIFEVSICHLTEFALLMSAKNLSLAAMPATAPATYECAAPAGPEGIPFALDEDSRVVFTDASPVPDPEAPAELPLACAARVARTFAVETFFGTPTGGLRTQWVRYRDTIAPAFAAEPAMALVDCLVDEQTGEGAPDLEQLHGQLNAVPALVDCQQAAATRYAWTLPLADQALQCGQNYTARYTLTDQCGNSRAVERLVAIAAQPPRPVAVGAITGGAVGGLAAAAGLVVAAVLGTRFYRRSAAAKRAARGPIEMQPLPAKKDPATTTADPKDEAESITPIVPGAPRLDSAALKAEAKRRRAAEKQAAQERKRAAALRQQAAKHAALPPLQAQLSRVQALAARAAQASPAERALLEALTRRVQAAAVELGGAAATAANPLASASSPATSSPAPADMGPVDLSLSPGQPPAAQQAVMTLSPLAAPAAFVLGPEPPRPVSAVSPLSADTPQPLHTQAHQPQPPSLTESVAPEGHVVPTPPEGAPPAKRRPSSSSSSTSASAPASHRPAPALIPPLALPGDLAHDIDGFQLPPGGPEGWQEEDAGQAALASDVLRLFDAVPEPPQPLEPLAAQPPSPDLPEAAEAILASCGGPAAREEQQQQQEQAGGGWMEDADAAEEDLEGPPPVPTPGRPTLSVELARTASATPLRAATSTSPGQPMSRPTSPRDPSWEAPADR